MYKKKRIWLAVTLAIFVIILAAFLGFQYYMEHLPEAADDDKNRIAVTEIDTSLVTEIGIISEKGSIELQKEDNKWICLNDEACSLDTEKIEQFLDNAGSITSELKIENVTDMSQYGLDNPAINITLKWSSNLYTIKIGDFNAMAGCYYLSVNDEAIVYTIDNSLYYSLDKAKDDFALTDVSG